jgi:hypothetical protein
MRFRGITLLVAVSLLTSPATAYAECAWVLWEKKLEKKYPPIPTLTWSVNIRQEDIFETRKACELESERRLDVELRSWSREAVYEAFRNVAVPGVTVRRKDATDYLFNVSYHCFPDTMDPRGPKGGAR